MPKQTVMPRARLFGLSFLMLFTELALIRWTGANIVYLSYFSNFVLLGSFLGIGIGFLRARARVNLFPYAPVALALLILFVRVFPVEVVRTGNAGIIFFGYGKFNASGPPTWVTLPVVFLAVAAVMAMIGEGVARTFITFPALDAYRLDIAGSIVGIAAFSALSFLDAKPVVWALIVALVMLLLYGTRVGLLQVVAVVAVVLLLWSESLSSSDIWSPYYRISVQAGGPGRYSINVNGIPHQNIIPARQLQKVYSQPYLDDPGNPLNNVLIIGAGGMRDDLGAQVRQLGLDGVVTFGGWVDDPGSWVVGASVQACPSQYPCSPEPTAAWSRPRRLTSSAGRCSSTSAPPRPPSSMSGRESCARSA